jgi:DNA-directed RNA polymerase subunit RPC12/RpoP
MIAPAGFDATAFRLPTILAEVPSDSSLNSVRKFSDFLEAPPLKIAFPCQQCGKQLVADSALAGRTGRCRYCGQSMLVPSGKGSTAGQRPAHSGASAKASGQASPAVARAPVADWRTAVASQLAPPAGPAAAAASTGAAAASTGAAAASTSAAAATRRAPRSGRADSAPAATAASGYSLRPVTPAKVQAIAATDWDNAELGEAVAPPAGIFARSATATATAWPVPSGPSPVFIAYRMFFSLLARATTWISETSYTISFVIIILSVASGMIGRHSLAALGCGTIVALNLIGLAGDLASLVTMSFRKNPLRGALFLIPPFTFYYLWSDWDRYRDTVSRMRIPAVTLALVAAAYLFVPWLRGGKESNGFLDRAATQVVGTLEEKLGGPGASIEQGLKTARAWVREVPLPAALTPPASDGPAPPAPGPKP